MSRTRLWLERLGVAIIAVLSLTAPFVFGFVYYLGVTDGIEISPGDPLHESRIWMQKEKRGPTGIGWLRTAPVDGAVAGVQCANSQLIMLNWAGGLSIDTSTHYCKCFESTPNGLRESNVACK